MEDNSDAQDNSTFEMKLKEDVAAELEEFILLSRLALHDEAMGIAGHILWRHLQIFPVMAEISGYLVEQQDLHRLRRLVQDLDRWHITFAATEDGGFVELLKTLSAASAPRLIHISDLSPKYSRPLPEWDLIDYNSPVKVIGPWLELLITLTLYSSRSQKPWLHWHRSTQICQMCGTSSLLQTISSCYWPKAACEKLSDSKPRGRYAHLWTICDHHFRHESFSAATLPESAFLQISQKPSAILESGETTSRDGGLTPKHGLSSAGNQAYIDALAELLNLSKYIPLSFTPSSRLDTTQHIQIETPSRCGSPFLVLPALPKVGDFGIMASRAEARYGA